jgi:phosphoglycerate kinase
MSKLRTIADFKGQLAGKIVLCRVDLNVPMLHGRVEDGTRIRKIAPTIKELIRQNAKVVVLSHFGRPEGQFVREMSLAPLTDFLGEALDGVNVKFALDCVGEAARDAVANLKNGEVLLLENLRFHAGEEANNPKFVEELASLGDFYVNDTFSCSHRKHASILGIAKKLPAAAGLLMQDEIENLEKIMCAPERPMAAIVGGSKVSTKLKLLNTLIKKVDLIVIGGAMANTFLKASGYKIGKSMYEEKLLETAAEIMQKARKYSCEILLPVDVVVADKLEAMYECKIVPVNKIPASGMVLDIGPLSIAEIAQKLESYKTLVWNGPLGAFEFRPFDVATISLARSVAALTSGGNLISVAGGGDIVAALNVAGLTESFTYISTAGGAFLDWLQGESLPGIEVLRTA